MTPHSAAALTDGCYILRCPYSTTVVHTHQHMEFWCLKRQMSLLKGTFPFWRHEICLSAFSLFSGKCPFWKLVMCLFKRDISVCLIFFWKTNFKRQKNVKREMSLLKCVFLKIIQKAHFKKGHFPFEICLSIKTPKDTFQKTHFPLKRLNYNVQKGTFSFPGELKFDIFDH